MASKPSRLSTRIDFEAEGKQSGYLQLPHSVHRSAYGWLPVPLVCVKNGAGPTVLLTSGVHGDEYEGQITLSKLIRDLEADDVSGRIIVLPMANFPAAKAGLRTSPIDDLNLNRIFPGDADGTPTRALAHYIDSVLMPMVDYALDLHSGGSSLMYFPTAILGGAQVTAATRREEIELGRIFGAPYSFLFPDSQGDNGTMAATAARHGVISIGTEMGGTGTVTPECLRICEAGVRRVLRHLGVWQGAVSPDEAPAVASRLLTAPSWDYFTYAPEDGVFEPRFELGDEVETGQLAGFMHEPATPGLAAVPVRFEVPGLVVCKRVPGRTNRGDCLFHLGVDLDG